ncbi:integrase_H2C2 domain-containing protein [Trichonephila clavipes]|nr:integrase_H2C2 domain-containing protein [Trichonephila clavipes]
MDKGSMVADSFRSEQECCAELALVWKYAKEGKGNYYEVVGYLFRRDKNTRGEYWAAGSEGRCEEILSHVKNVSSLDRSIDPPSLKGHKYILRLVDQHTRWGEAVPLTSLSAKVLRMLEQFVVSIKEQLPAPGNRSNERRYREKDLATTERRKVGTGEKREGDEKSRGREK